MVLERKKTRLLGRKGVMVWCVELYDPQLFLRFHISGAVSYTGLRGHGSLFLIHERGWPCFPRLLGTGFMQRCGKLELPGQAMFCGRLRFPLLTGVWKFTLVPCLFNRILFVIVTSVAFFSLPNWDQMCVKSCLDQRHFWNDLLNTLMNIQIAYYLRGQDQFSSSHSRMSVLDDM